MARLQVTVVGFKGQSPAEMLVKVRTAMVDELIERLGEISLAGERKHEKSKGMRYFDFEADFRDPAEAD